MESAHFHRWGYITICLLLAVIFVSIIFPSPVQADVGVHPVLPGGSNIEPEADTPIQMASERVVMNVRLATAEDNSILQLNPDAYGLNTQAVWYPAVAMVVADFTMHNPTDAPIALTTWFPLASALQTVSWELNPNETVPAIASFQVSQDGVGLDYTVSQQPNPNGEDKPFLPWASFLVSYPPNADTSLTVSYLTPLTQSIKSSELALYYIFQTGAGWAGPIGQAELIVNLPYPASPNTLVRISPDNLRIPYPMADSGATILPSSAVMEGNQARWEWNNFEPTAQDDFALWLVSPELWQQLEAAKAQAQADPNDAPALIDLGMVYYKLAVGAYTRPTIFNDRYRDPGIEAFTKASELWPENPIPHTAIALLTLSQYVPSGDAPPDVIQFVYNHLQLAKELEAEHPELVGYDAISTSMVEDVLATYQFSKITTTAEISISSTAQAYQTQAAAPSVPSLTPSPLPSLTPTSSPSPPPQAASPTPTVTPQAAPSVFSGRGMAAIIILTVCSFTLVVVLVILGIAIVRRSPQGD